VTNFDPGGFLVLLTVIPAVIAGAVSVGLAHLLARLGYADYETGVVAVLGLLLLAWIGAALLIETTMLVILAVTLSMAGAYVATRSVRTASYGWVLGVVLMFLAFGAASAAGIYQGVDQSGVPQGLLARNVGVAYAVGLFVFGLAGGGVVRLLRALWDRRGSDAPG
jgi:lysylphosphatidylglycerol synthetase-like protein (DUF2156 family)